MTVKMKQSLPPEIDTKLDGDKIHSGPGNGDGSGFLENDTPKHANRKTGEYCARDGACQFRIVPML